MFGTVLIGIGALALLYVTIKILIHAFKSAGILHAIICFLCGIYALYWLFAKYDESDKKNLIIIFVVGIVLYIIGFGMAGASAVAAGGAG
ncbi:MAG: hypothetical protein ACK4NQ_01040 [Fimbriimonadaceae bacterium]